MLDVNYIQQCGKILDALFKCVETFTLIFQVDSSPSLESAETNYEYPCHLKEIVSHSAEPWTTTGIRYLELGLRSFHVSNEGEIIRALLSGNQALRGLDITINFTVASTILGLVEGLRHNNMLQEHTLRLDNYVLSSNLYRTLQNFLGSRPFLSKFTSKLFLIFQNLNFC